MKLQPAHIGTTNQRGASMIELMITMLLGLFLMAGVLQLFSSNKTTYSNMEGISQIQENARAGLERIKDRVRMAGYMGCSNLGILEPNNITSPTVDFSTDTLIKGDNDTNTSNAIVDGTDILTVISTTLEDTFLSADMATATSEVPLTSPGNLQVNDPVMITDCENADIFRVATIGGGPSLTYSGTLSKPYLASSTRIMSLQNTTYSVETTNRVDESGTAVQSLFETPAGGTRVEIMTGVEDMRISYGEDTDNDGQADEYNIESAVSSWASVVSVRLRLLVGTGRAIGPALRPYVNLDGVLVSEDRRMRRTFTTTISLRNRSS